MTASSASTAAIKGFLGVACLASVNTTPGDVAGDAGKVGATIGSSSYATLSTNI